MNKIKFKKHEYKKDQTNGLHSCIWRQHTRKSQSPQSSYELAQERCIDLYRRWGIRGRRDEDS